jgi:hypothetical protein
MEEYAESQIQLLTSKTEFSAILAKTMKTFHSECQEITDQVR